VVVLLLVMVALRAQAQREVEVVELKVLMLEHPIAMMRQQQLHVLFHVLRSSNLEPPVFGYSLVVECSLVLQVLV
jgi:hypothetical protein